MVVVGMAGTGRRREEATEGGRARAATVSSVVRTTAEETVEDNRDTTLDGITTCHPQTENTIGIKFRPSSAEGDF